MQQHTDPRIDRCRGAVYQAEDTIASVMARPHRGVWVGREVVTLPPVARFGSVPAAQAFVDQVLADPRTAASYPGVGPARVEAKRGFRSATYTTGTIHIPAADPRGRWALTKAVVLHEIAHHLVHQLGEPGHGRAFRAALRHLYALHVGPGAAALLGHLLDPLDELPDPVGVVRSADDPANAPARRVAALLAKAESTTSEEEADALVAKAAEVAQRHSIDLSVAAMASQARRPAAPTHRMLTIGEPRKALNKLLVSLYVEIARGWSVKVDIGVGSTYVLGYGMPADLDQVESVFATASTMMVGRAAEHVRSGQWRDELYRPIGSMEVRPVTATVARNAFCVGFITRLGERLREAQQQAKADAARGLTSDGFWGPEQMPSDYGAGSGTPSGGQRVELALRARDLAVTDYHQTVSQARGSWRGSATTAGSAQASRRAGARAADAYGRRGIPGGRRALGR